MRGEKTWISHSDVNLKMRKKRVMAQTASSAPSVEKTSKSNVSAQLQTSDYYLLFFYVFQR